MKNRQFYESIQKSSAHTQSRESHACLVLQNPELLEDLLEIALDPNDKSHHKACWILELVLEEKIAWLLPHLDDFCRKLPQMRNQSAIRPMSKICLFAAENHLKMTGKNSAFLNPEQFRLITEACLDWLIGGNKVAPKAYSMRALFRLGKIQTWIHPELRLILEQDYPLHTAAYKAAAREILKAID